MRHFNSFKMFRSQTFKEAAAIDEHVTFGFNTFSNGISLNRMLFVNPGGTGSPLSRKWSFEANLSGC